MQRQASGMLLCVLAAGLLIAYAKSRLLRTLLYGVRPHEPSTMAAVTLAADRRACRSIGTLPDIPVRSQQDFLAASTIRHC
jgi:hypothetical protein